MKILYVLKKGITIDEERVMDEIKNEKQFPGEDIRIVTKSIHAIESDPNGFDCITKKMIQTEQMYRFGETLEPENTQVVPDSIKKDGVRYEKSNSSWDVEKGVLEIYYLHPDYTESENKDIEHLISKEELQKSLERIREKTIRYLDEVRNFKMKKFYIGN